MDTVKIISALTSHQVLDVADGKVAWGQPCVIYPPHAPSTDNQAWVYDPYEGYIYSKLDPGYVLDVLGGQPPHGPNIGLRVGIYPKNDPPTLNQKWTWNDKGQIISKMKGFEGQELVLDVAGAADDPSTFVNVYPSWPNKSPNQSWSSENDMLIRYKPLVTFYNFVNSDGHVTNTNPSDGAFTLYRIMRITSLEKPLTFSANKVRVVNNGSYGYYGNTYLSHLEYKGMYGKWPVELDFSIDLEGGESQDLTQAQVDLILFTPPVNGVKFKQLDYVGAVGLESTEYNCKLVESMDAKTLINLASSAYT